MVRDTALNSSDSFPYYPPDNHHGLDDIYWRRGAAAETKMSAAALPYYYSMDVVLRRSRTLYYTIPNLSRGGG